MKVILTIFILCLHPLCAENIALLVVATGKYSTFVPNLISSARKFFLNNHKVTYFIFTDQLKMIRGQAANDEVVIYQKKLGWPFDSMMRYHIYKSHAALFANYDYLFACDADMCFVDFIGDEILGQRVAVLHPGFYNRPRSSYTYESNQNSTAYIPMDQGIYYFCGGFYGGVAKEFIRICHVNMCNIDLDYANGFISVWHDESHWNRYCVDNFPTVILSPSYCYTTPYCLDFDPKIRTVDKDIEFMRGD